MKRKVLLLAAFLFSLFFFHFSRINAQSWLWGNYGIGDATVWSVGVDRNGNCYLSGLFPNDTLQFGSNNLMNSTITNAPYSSNFDAFIVKLNPQGKVLWAKQTVTKNSIDTLGNFEPCTVATDNKGNVYLNSNFPDTLFVGSNTLTAKGFQNTCVTKYDAFGNVLWAKQSTGKNNLSTVAGASTSCDNHGNVFVSGAFADTVNFGSFTIIGTSPMYYYNSFLVKYDSNGNVKWTKQSVYLGDYSNDLSYGVINDRFGNAFITGVYIDSISFGSFKLTGGNPNFYLVKYDANGNIIWAKQNAEINGGSSAGISLVTDQPGNIYATGQFAGKIVFGQDTLIAPPSLGSFFLVKYDSNGNVLWAKQATILDNNTWNAWGLSIDNYKHLYLSVNGGYQQCKVGFGGDTLSMYDTAKYDGASLIFKLDSNGNTLCSSIVPVGALGGVENGIASDTSGNYVYFGAALATPVIFGKDTINPFAYPINKIQEGNYFPFAARWEACDSNALTTSVLEQKPIGQVTLYPNPNAGSFTIVLQNINEPTQMEIYNVLGEEIYKTKLNFNNAQLNLGSQPEGIYFYRVLSENGGFIGSGKLIIEK
ncbi:MAG TPA: T9SS type A sorting domain-containing protein [Bacteroidia bacterium]|jgi:hypothetical protein|nr:T9SS type A sorting domain-containing protein [Bacteroidia bacterium]